MSQFRRKAKRKKRCRDRGNKSWTVGETQELNLMNLGGRKDSETQVKHIRAGNQTGREPGAQEMEVKGETASKYLNDWTQHAKNLTYIQPVYSVHYPSI